VVPGCTGGESDEPGKDYCTSCGPSISYIWLSEVGNNGVREDNNKNMTEQPLNLCEGVVTPMINVR